MCIVQHIAAKVYYSTIDGSHLFNVVRPPCFSAWPPSKATSLLRPCTISQAQILFIIDYEMQSNLLKRILIGTACPFNMLVVVNEPTYFQIKHVIHSILKLYMCVYVMSPLSISCKIMDDPIKLQSPLVCHSFSICIGVHV